MGKSTFDIGVAFRAENGKETRLKYKGSKKGHGLSAWIMFSYLCIAPCRLFLAKLPPPPSPHKEKVNIPKKSLWLWWFMLVGFEPGSCQNEPVLRGVFSPKCLVSPSFQVGF